MFCGENNCLDKSEKLLNIATQVRCWHWFLPFKEHLHVRQSPDKGGNRLLRPDAGRQTVCDGVLRHAHLPRLQLHRLNWSHGPSDRCAAWEWLRERVDLIRIDRWVGFFFLSSGPSVVNLLEFYCRCLRGNNFLLMFFICLHFFFPL